MNFAKSAWALFVSSLLAGLQGLAASARDNPATGTPDSFLGMTNIYTFHLTIAPDQWAIMEELDQFKENAVRLPPPGADVEPGRFRPAQPPGRDGPGPGPGPGGNGPMMGIEFKKGTATLEFQGQPFGAIRVRFKGNSSFRFAHEIVRGLLATNFNAARLFPVIDAMAATIRSSLANDRMVSLPQFEAALSELSQPETLAGDNVGRSDLRRGEPGGPGGPRQPRPALKAFINQRATSVQLQLEGKTNGYLPREIRPGPNGGPRPAGPAPGPPR